MVGSSLDRNSALKNVAQFHFIIGLICHNINSFRGV
jgi:hypothetical protein